MRPDLAQLGRQRDLGVDVFRRLDLVAAQRGGGVGSRIVAEDLGGPLQQRGALYAQFVDRRLGEHRAQIRAAAFGRGDDVRRFADREIDVGRPETTAEQHQVVV